MRHRVYHNAKRILCLGVMMSFILSLPAQAKEDPKPDKSSSKSNEKMPEAVGSPSMNQGYEAAKKAIEETLKDDSPSVMDRVKKALEAVIQGDPKTDYSKSENDGHAKDKSGKRSNLPNKKIDLSGWLYASSTYTTSSTITAYYYNPSPRNPYNMVRVVYDSASMALISATGYQTVTTSGGSPDLSGMTLADSAIRSDGTLAYESYESVPNKSGAFTQLSLYYDDTGVSLLYYTQTIVQPLDPKKVKLP